MFGDNTCMGNPNVKRMLKEKGKVMTELKKLIK